jgi:hypothetical protein
MPLSRRLKPAIALKDGRMLVTLKDAAELILSLPVSYHTGPTWLNAAHLLKDVAEEKQSAIAEFGLQLHRALTQSRMLAATPRHNASNDE